LVVVKTPEAKRALAVPSVALASAWRFLDLHWDLLEFGMRRYGQLDDAHHLAYVALAPYVDAGFCSAFCSAVVVVRIESVSWGRNLRLPSVKSEQLQIAASTIYS